MTFLEFLTMRGIPFRPHTKPGEIWIACPVCSDSKFRLGINWRTNKGHCFNCSWKSRRAIQGVLRAWKLEARIDTPQEAQDAPKAEARPIHLPEDFFPLAAIQDADGSPFIDAKVYMLGRGFSPGQLSRHRIGASFSGQFAFRIIIPVFYGRKLCGLVARTWADREPKYLNSTGERTIWNLRKLDPQTTLVLAEGIFKAMALERIASRESFQCGALLGHSITEAQIQKLKECKAKRILLWPDPDPQGLEGMIQVAQQLQDAGFLIQLPAAFPKRQADEEDRDQLRSLLKGRIPLSPALMMKMRLEVAKR
jgi:hypothetical protein